ncbi:MAG: serine/threonine protein kinase [Myxococcota bacterium]|nr:serine/threonine protein kinase [Myxococcota bacterium]
MVIQVDGHPTVNEIRLPKEQGTRGKYRVLAQLGEGGMATVYLAVARGPRGFNKLVVLKALKRDVADDPAFRTMFLREAQLAGRLNHPGVVQTYDVIETAGTPVIVMEYLDGQTLAKIKRRAQRDLTLDNHLRIIGDATGALHYAHELTDFDGTTVGLVHRDMTPHNVFVTFEGQVKLLDFGIAKLTASNVDTQVGIIKGKLRYMPPEQIAGDPVDRRADIYAVGVMLWEAATGGPMWKGCSDVMVMKHLLAGEIPRPRSTNPQTPEQLEAICMKALAPARDDRYSTAAELEADIDAFLDELGSRANGRAIGKFTSALFADVRAETKALIETQLSKVALLPAAELAMLPSEDLVSLSLQAYGQLPAEQERAPLRSSLVTALSVAGDAPRPRWMPGQRRRIALATAALGLLAVAILGLSLRSGSKTARSEAGPRPALAANVTPSGAAPAVLRESRMSMRISASPRDAKLRLDGEPLSGNPYVTTMPADGSRHTVTVAAPGYEPRTTAFTAERDSELVVDLERTKAIVADEPKASSGPPPGLPAVSPPAARPVRCDPPFWIDSSGIKRFKVECL